MKKLSINYFKQTEKADCKNNTAEANETMMNDFAHADCKIFSAADLWNIQRKGKNVTPRRWLI